MSRMLTIGVLAALCCGAVGSPLAGGGVAHSSGLRAKGTAWATSRGPDTVTAFDGATGRVLATVPVGKAPMGLAVPPGTNKLYVGNEGSNSVSVISLTRREVIATINVGSRPHHMYASPDGSRVYVAEFGTNKIGVIDTMTDSLIAEWATGPPTDRTHAPAPTQDGKTLYAVNSGANKLVALDAQTGAIQWSIPTGDNPSEFHVSHDGRTGYLSVRNLDEIDVISQRRTERAARAHASVVTAVVIGMDCMTDKTAGAMRPGGATAVRRTRAARHAGDERSGIMRRTT
jgi:YVTN family beta-propeller protein